MSLGVFAAVFERVQELRIKTCQAGQVLGVYLIRFALVGIDEPYLLRGLATSTSWPHSSKSRLTQGEWVPASIAMRIGPSEEKRRRKASGVVRRADPPP